MKKINQLPLSRTRNAEHYQFFSSFLGVFTAAVATTLKMAGLRERALALLAKMDEVYKLNYEFEKTSELKDLDARRDQPFSVFKKGVDFYKAGGGTAEQATAAAAIDHLLKPYRGAARRSFYENSAELGKFIKDVQAPPYAAHLATLNQTGVIAQLKALNDEFAALYDARSVDSNDRASLEKMKALRNDMDELFREIAETAPGIYAYESDPAKKQSIGEFMDQTNALIRQLQRILANRGIKTGTGTGDGGGDNGGGDNGGDGGGDNSGGGGGDGPLG